MSEMLSRKAAGHPRTWGSKLSATVNSYNNTVHSTTGFPPSVAFYVGLHDSRETIDRTKLSDEVLDPYIEKYKSYKSLRLEIQHVIRVRDFLISLKRSFTYFGRL